MAMCKHIISLRFFTSLLQWNEGEELGQYDQGILYVCVDILKNKHKIIFFKSEKTTCSLKEAPRFEASAYLLASLA